MVEENYKLTLDLRAAVYFLNYTVLCLMVSSGWRETLLRPLRSIYRNGLIRLANRIGDWLSTGCLQKNGLPGRRHERSPPACSSGRAPGNPLPVRRRARTRGAP